METGAPLLTTNTRRGLAGVQGHLASTTVLPSTDECKAWSGQGTYRDWGAGHKDAHWFTLTLFKQSNSVMESVARTTHRAQGSATSTVLPPTWQCGPTHRKYTQTDWSSALWLLRVSVLKVSLRTYFRWDMRKDITLRAFKISFILRKWRLTDFKVVKKKKVPTCEPWGLFYFKEKGLSTDVSETGNYTNLMFHREKLLNQTNWYKWGAM